MSPLGCVEPVPPLDDEALLGFLDETSGPPEPQPFDDLMREKADVIVLPTISVTVWAVGALMVYIGAQQVFSNTISDFELVLGDALGQSADWSWAEETNEVFNQASHLTESLGRVAYRSEESDFYSVTGNDYIRFLNMVSPSTIINPNKLKELLDGKIRPWGRYAKEYFAALQVASVQARHLSNTQAGQGLCARATVQSLGVTPVPYTGFARAKGAIDIIPAVVLASLKATIRCGMYDTGIREFVYSYFNVKGTRGTLADIFISHSLKSAKLLFKYVDVCQMPPTIVVDIDGGDCHDITFN
jgi:hypothetical protein